MNNFDILLFKTLIEATAGDTDTLISNLRRTHDMASDILFKLHRYTGKDAMGRIEQRHYHDALNNIQMLKNNLDNFASVMVEGIDLDNTKLDPSAGVMSDGSGGIPWSGDIDEFKKVYREYTDLLGNLVDTLKNDMTKDDINTAVDQIGGIYDKLETISNQHVVRKYSANGVRLSPDDKRKSKPVPPKKAVVPPAYEPSTPKYNKVNLVDRSGQSDDMEDTRQPTTGTQKTGNPFKQQYRDVIKKSKRSKLRKAVDAGASKVAAGASKVADGINKIKNKATPTKKKSDMEHTKTRVLR